VQFAAKPKLLDADGDFHQKERASVVDLFEMNAQLVAAFHTNGDKAKTCAAFVAELVVLKMLEVIGFEIGWFVEGVNFSHMLRQLFNGRVGNEIGSDDLHLLIGHVKNKEVVLGAVIILMPVNEHILQRLDADEEHLLHNHLGQVLFNDLSFDLCFELGNGFRVKHSVVSQNKLTYFIYIFYLLRKM